MKRTIAIPNESKQIGRISLGGILLSAVLLLNSTTLSAQPRVQAGTPVGFGANGFHLYSASLAAGYMSSAFGAGTLAPGLGGDYQGWASLTGGYSFTGPKGVFAIDYTPGYTARLRYSQLRSFNQALTLTGTRRLGSKTLVHFNGSGSEGSYESFLFSGGGLGSVVGTGGTTDVLTGGLSSASGASLSPAQLIVYGGKVRTAVSSMGVSYAATTRLTVSLDASGSLTATKYDNTTTLAPVLPRYLNATGAFGLGYSLSPSTTIGSRLSYSYTTSKLANFDDSVAALFLDRKLGQHWFTALSAGPSLYRTKGGPVTAATLSYDASGTLGYRFRQTSLATSYHRRAGDSYGFGAEASDTYDAAWDHFTRTLGWSFRASGGQQRLSGGSAGGFRASYAAGGITHALGRQLTLSLEYSYARYVGAAYPRAEFQSGRISLTWIPFLRDTPSLINSDPSRPNIPRAVP